MFAINRLPTTLELAAPPLRLRPWRPCHVEALYEAARESVTTVGHWLPWCRANYAWEDAVAWIESCQSGWSRGEPYAFGIFGEDEQLLGGIGLNRLDREHRSANLGYWVRESAQGKGIAPAAVQAIATFGFNCQDLMRIEIVAAIANWASRRCAEKAGARFEGIARQRLMIGATQMDAAVYGLIPADLAQTAAAQSAAIS
jgi:RimJ/RimL family protein N-acetyltransferase